ncbi:MAG: hypothetical protein OXI37_04765 [Gammaproteobacteria bacterium]|nr:hypothetical protein [Gammaproteobacteria bacterium]
MTTISLDVSLQFIAVKSSVSDRWVLTCDSLGVALEANSPNEFSGLIEECLDALFNDLKNDNELDVFLDHKGWNRVEYAESTGRDFDIPWMLTKESPYSDSTRKAS